MTWYDVANSVLIIYIWANLLTVVKQFFTKRKYWLIFFFIYSFIELLSIPMAVKGYNNLLLYYISKPLEFIFISSYFFEVLAFKKNIRLTAFVLTIVLSLAFLFTNHSDEYTSLGQMVYTCCILTYCIIYFYRIAASEEFIRLDQSEFWYCTGLFVFFGVNICADAPMNFLIKNYPDIARKLFYLIIANSIIFYLLTLYAIRNEKTRLTDA